MTPQPLGKKLREVTENRLHSVQTSDLAVLTAVDLTTMRVNAQLKHKVSGNTIELFNLPYAMQTYAGSTFIIAPRVGDVVLVVFSRHELEDQLNNRSVVGVNETRVFNLNHAVVIHGVVSKADTPPTIAEGEALLFHETGSEIRIKADGEIKLTHSSGAYIRIYSGGNIELKANRIDHNPL